MNFTDRYSSLRGFIAGFIALFLFAAVWEHTLGYWDSWWRFVLFPVVGFLVAYAWPFAFLSAPIGEVAGRFAYHYIIDHDSLALISKDKRPVLGLLVLSAFFGVAVLLGSVPGSIVGTIIKRQSTKKAAGAGAAE